MKENSNTEVEGYISSFPKEIQKALRQIRQAIKDSAPDAEETMRYGIPTFRLNGNIVHYAAFKKHIGFYPTPYGIEKFKKEPSTFELSKGTVRFKLDEPIPINLVKTIVKHRVKECSRY